MTALILGARVLDSGLAALDTEATHFYICSAVPTTFTEASSTFALGTKNLGAGACFGAPAAGVAGRKVVSVAITDGSVTAGGTATYWAATDNDNSRLLATGALSVITGSAVVTTGQAWSLGVLDVEMLSSSTSNSAAYTNFIARTTGLDATHLTAYAALLNDLTTDGIFVKLDALYVLCTQDATTARLNLVSTSFQLLPTSAPTFTADRGYTFSGSNYLDTQLAPNGGTTFLQNSAHLTLFTRTTGSNTTKQIHGALNAGATSGTYIGCSTATGGLHQDQESSINNAFGGVDINLGESSPGCNTTNRSGASAREQYWNGSQTTGSDSQASQAPISETLWIGGRNFGGGLNQPSDEQVMFFSVGGSLSAGNASNLYTRLNAFKTAMGA